MIKWLENRFWDFRKGHSIYLAFLISLWNFTIINYRLLIEEIPFLKNIFTHLRFFIVFFVIIYPTLAIFIGFTFYRKSQFHTDLEINVDENPYLRKLRSGKEILLTFPMQRLNVKLNLKLYKKFNIITKEEEEELKKYIDTLDILIKGESI